MGVPVSRILFLVFILIPGNFSFHLSKRHEDSKKLFKKIIPSCTELLNMWQHVHRMTRHSLATNEIPVFPMNFMDFLISQTHPKTSDRHPATTSQEGKENVLNDEVFLKSFSKPFQDSDQEFLLKMGYSDSLFESQPVLLQVPKQDGKHEYQTTAQIIHPQDIVPESKTSQEKFSDQSTVYEPAFSLNEPPDYNGLFGAFDEPVAQDLSASRDLSRTLPFLRPHAAHHSFRKDGPDIARHQADSVLIGFKDFPRDPPPPPLEDDVMNMFGTVLHDTDEEQQWNQGGKQTKIFDPLSQWMTRGDMGSFGRFASDNVAESSEDSESLGSKLWKTTGPNQPAEDPMKSSEFEFQKSYLSLPEEEILSRVRCTERVGGVCHSDVQCVCSGRNILRCVMGECRREDAFGVSDDFDLGTWHEGPLPFSDLGMNRGRKVQRNPWPPM